jgi:uncharacterized protein (DUF302 family)
MTVSGLTIHRSMLDPRQTADRLAAAIQARGLTLFARVDHAAGAAAAGMPLRPTELLMFGNAKGGTALMQAAQTIGIDLPLRALVWQDEAGATWLGVNDPGWLADRHGIGGAVDAPVAAMRTLLGALAHAATTSNT